MTRARQSVGSTRRSGMNGYTLSLQGFRLSLGAGALPKVHHQHGLLMVAC